MKGFGERFLGRGGGESKGVAAVLGVGGEGKGGKERKRVRFFGGPNEGEGREVILSLIGASEFFGEMSLLDGRPRSATVQALEPCEVLYVPKCAFTEFMQSDGAARLILQTIVARLREADRKIEGLALTDVYTRVTRVLSDTARDVNGEWIVEPGSEQIAKIVGASREMVSRVLKDLRKKGMIGRNKRRIIVLDRESVARRALGAH